MRLLVYRGGREGDGCVVFLALGIFYFHQIQPLRWSRCDKFISRILLLKQLLYDFWRLLMMPNNHSGPYNSSHHVVQKPICRYDKSQLVIQNFHTALVHLANSGSDFGIKLRKRGEIMGSFKIGKNCPDDFWANALMRHKAAKTLVEGRWFETELIEVCAAERLVAGVKIPGNRFDVMYPYIQWQMGA
jgi:hypothetical protein